MDPNVEDADEPAEVPIGRVTAELTRRRRDAQASGVGVMRRAQMSNLIIFCQDQDRAALADMLVPAIVRVHPAKVLLLVGMANEPDSPIRAFVQVRDVGPGPGDDLYCEQVTLKSAGRGVGDLPYAVRSLIIGDLPTNLWWATPQPPPFAGPILHDLAESVQQVLYDSSGWLDPHRGIGATHAWLERFERKPGRLAWRVASDLNWRRLKPWRRALSQSLAPDSAPGAIGSITEVLIEHGPHAVTHGWLLVSWLASRLQWTPRSVEVQLGDEIAWRLDSPQGAIRLIIRRLPEGPSQIRRVRVACHLNGRAGALDIALEDQKRLCVRSEGFPGEPRTLAFAQSTLAEMIGRQLSDREEDPVFAQSIAFAQPLARGVVG
jgi:glucose-6-phosphate dehydrogenase assembly protein OpcA